MAKSSTLNFTQNINAAFVTFTNSDAANTVKTALTAGADDEIVKAIQFSSDETASARVIDILINDGTSDRLVCSVNVPLNSGFNGTVAAVDGLSSALQPGLPLDALGKRILPLKGGHVLKFRNQTQPNSGKTITAMVITEKY